MYFGFGGGGGGDGARFGEGSLCRRGSLGADRGGPRSGPRSGGPLSLTRFIRAANDPSGELLLPVANGGAFGLGRPGRLFGVAIFGGAEAGATSSAFGTRGVFVALTVLGRFMVNGRKLLFLGSVGGALTGVSGLSTRLKGPAGGSSAAGGGGGGISVSADSGS